MRLRVVAGVVALALSLGACTSSTTGKPTPLATGSQPTSTAPSTTEAPISISPASPTSLVPTTGPNVHKGEKPPSLSQIGMTHTNEGADAFARFWISTWDWAYATTNASLMRRYFSKSCTDCVLAAAQFAHLREKHEHILGGRFDFHRSMLVLDDHRYGASIADDVSFGQSALRAVNARGRTVQHDGAVTSTTFRLWLRWTGKSWTVAQKGHVN